MSVKTLVDFLKNKIDEGQQYKTGTYNNGFVTVGEKKYNASLTNDGLYLKNGATVDVAVVEAEKKAFIL